jgi:hypothetical protein
VGRQQHRVGLADTGGETEVDSQPPTAVGHISRSPGQGPRHFAIALSVRAQSGS